MLIAVRPQKLFLWLVACIGALVCLHVVALRADDLLPGHRSAQLRELFDLSGERNVPALFSTLLLGFASIALLLNWRIARRSFPQGSNAWLALAGVFAFLALDEYIMIHERLSGPATALLGTANVPVFAWVIPYAIFASVAAGFFFRFWWRLPRDIRWNMAMAGAIYVGGALGMEFVGSLIYERVGSASLYYELEVIVEESMEMIGIALFIRTLAQLIQTRVGSLTLQFDTRNIDSHDQLMKDLNIAERRKGERRAG